MIAIAACAWTSMQPISGAPGARERFLDEWATVAGVSRDLPYPIMGVVNVTPASFSAGGVFDDEVAATAHARGLIGEGASIVDVGGESPRPGAAPVPAGDELDR